MRLRHVWTAAHSAALATGGRETADVCVDIYLAIALRIEAWVGRVRLRPNRIPPRGERGPHGAHAVGLLRREIPRLPEVLTQPIQLGGIDGIVVFNELPVAVAHGATRSTALIVIVREVPEKGSTRRGSAAGEQGREG